ncbi:type VII secretion [Micractinium conductrix]|uniref:Type VII secretion n=1 Tax=Micractinium conductrix TaxID=554055 RepID=A0A2P6VHY3_9CHLO|nr:type VII secretion [Micractinium conductrix]|eukprot:PSC73692.1 type VII secretion [Micractinium conductrix]
MRSTAILAACLLALSTAASARVLTQGTDPIQWIDPSGTPEECTGGLVSGDQWAGDEIECHVCGRDYQLKCDLDTDMIGDDSVKCEIGKAGVGGALDNAMEFECVVDKSKEVQNQCDWRMLEDSLQGCALEPVRRIMAPRPTPSHFLSMRRHTAALAACLLLALACGAKARALAQDPAPGSAAEQCKAGWKKGRQWNSDELKCEHERAGGMFG